MKINIFLITFFVSVLYSTTCLAKMPKKPPSCPTGKITASTYLHEMVCIDQEGADKYEDGRFSMDGSCSEGLTSVAVDNADFFYCANAEELQAFQPEEVNNTTTRFVQRSWTPAEAASVVGDNNTIVFHFK